MLSTPNISISLGVGIIALITLLIEAYRRYLNIRIETRQRLISEVTSNQETMKLLNKQVLNYTEVDTWSDIPWSEFDISFSKSEYYSVKLRYYILTEDEVNELEKYYSMLETIEESYRKDHLEEPDRWIDDSIENVDSDKVREFDVKDAELAGRHLQRQLKKNTPKPLSRKIIHWIASFRTRNK